MNWVLSSAPEREPWTLCKYAVLPNSTFCQSFSLFKFQVPFMSYAFEGNVAMPSFENASFRIIRYSSRLNRSMVLWMEPRPDWILKFTFVPCPDPRFVFIKTTPLDPLDP